MFTKEDTIITAFAERAEGPGWCNRLICVIVRNRQGEFREEFIQPTEQTAEMNYLFDVSSAAHLSMVDAVDRFILINLFNKEEFN